MAEMMASEFVSKALKDKAFLVEVCKSIPEELLKKERSEERFDFGRAVGECLYGASRVMGFSFDADEFATEWWRQVGVLKGSEKMRFTARFISSLASTGRRRAE